MVVCVGGIVTTSRRLSERLLEGKEKREKAGERARVAGPRDARPHMPVTYEDTVARLARSLDALMVDGVRWWPPPSLVRKRRENALRGRTRDPVEGCMSSIACRVYQGRSVFSIFFPDSGISHKTAKHEFLDTRRASVL